MPLSQADIQKVQLHLQTYGVLPICHACGANNWTVGEEFVASHGVSPAGTATVGGQMVVPMVQVICNRCGYVYVNHFAAKIVGLIQ
jgi:hypothetical protein